MSHSFLTVLVVKSSVQSRTIVYLIDLCLVVLYVGGISLNIIEKVRFLPPLFFHVG